MRKSSLCALAPLALWFGPAVHGQVLETQHLLDYVARPASKFELTLHSRLRTQPQGLGLSQFRSGGILEYLASERFGVQAGYYHQLQSTGRDWSSRTHRVFGGVQGDVVRRQRYTIQARSSIERFLDNSDPDFTRFRNRLRIAANGNLAPYAWVELFLDARGWRSTRYSAGVRWRTRGRVELDFGYFYETRRTDVGETRHMISTAVRFGSKRTGVGEVL